MHAKIIDGTLIQYPYTWEDMRAQNPEVLFPDQYIESIFSDYGAVAIAQTAEPFYDRLTQVSSEGTPALIDGVWSQTWVVSDLAPERQAQIASGLRESNRQQAKQLLLDTDWSEMPSVRDTSVTPHLANWADYDTYRLALRRIVIDPPVTVEAWPEKPESVWA